MRKSVLILFVAVMATLVCGNAFGSDYAECLLFGDGTKYDYCYVPNGLGMTIDLYVYVENADGAAIATATAGQSGAGATSITKSLNGVTGIATDSCQYYITSQNVILYADIELSGESSQLDIVYAKASASW